MKRGAKATAATGVAACIACCAVPVLFAAGLLSAGLAAALAQWLPVLSAVLVGASLLAFVQNGRRRRALTCATAPGDDEACGCQPSPEHSPTR